MGSELCIRDSYNEGECVKAESAFQDAISRGFDAGKSWMLIATCRYEDAQKEERAVCSTTTAEQRKNSSKNQKRERAIAAFNNVPASSRENRNAKKWVSFIRAEAKAVEDRCEFEASVKEEQCFIQIRQAISNAVFTGGEVEITPECKPYKAKFDRLYTQKVATDQ